MVLVSNSPENNMPNTSLMNYKKTPCKLIGPEVSTVASLSTVTKNIIIYIYQWLGMPQKIIKELYHPNTSWQQHSPHPIGPFWYGKNDTMSNHPILIIYSVDAMVVSWRHNVVV